VGILRRDFAVSSVLEPVRVTNAGDLATQLAKTAERPAIFLSASVPYERQSLKTNFEVERNRRYLASLQPQRIRLTVTEITKTALMRQAQLIFGAHPAISPMVLEAARNLGAPPDSILIFQSAFFEGRIPHSTLELSNWSAGRFFFTPIQRGGEEHEERRRSLTEMRSLMVSPKNLRGAIFVGGMEGVDEEAELFKKANEYLPRYAVASTGSASMELFERSEGNFAGGLEGPDREMLRVRPGTLSRIA
jgi:SLOG cluster3 family